MSDEDVDIYGDIEADSPTKPKASDDAGAAGGAAAAHADERADEVIYGDVAPDTRGPDSAAGPADHSAPTQAGRPGQGSHPAATEAVDKSFLQTDAPQVPAPAPPPAADDNNLSEIFAALPRTEPKSRVFLSNLQWYTNDDDLVQVMAAIGVHDVVQVSFEDIKSNGKSKGIAMISFAGEDTARFVKQFIEEREVMIHGNHPIVTYHNPESGAPRGRDMRDGRIPGAGGMGMGRPHMMGGPMAPVPVATDVGAAGVRPPMGGRPMPPMGAAAPPMMMGANRPMRPMPGRPMGGDMMGYPTNMPGMPMPNAAFAGPMAMGMPGMMGEEAFAMMDPNNPYFAQMMMMRGMMPGAMMGAPGMNRMGVPFMGQPGMPGVPGGEGHDDKEADGGSGAGGEGSQSGGLSASGAAAAAARLRSPGAGSDAERERERGRDYDRRDRSDDRRYDRERRASRSPDRRPRDDRDRRDRDYRDSRDRKRSHSRERDDRDSRRARR